MAVDLQQRLLSLVAKAEVLNRRYESVAEAYNQARAEAERMQQKCDALQHKVEELERRNMYLTTVLTFSPTREDVAKTRLTISNLVREIDKCILDLTDASSLKP